MTIPTANPAREEEKEALEAILGEHDFHVEDDDCWIVKIRLGEDHLGDFGADELGVILGTDAVGDSGNSARAGGAGGEDHRRPEDIQIDAEDRDFGGGFGPFGSSSDSRLPILGFLRFRFPEGYPDGGGESRPVLSVEDLHFGIEEDLQNAVSGLGDSADSKFAEGDADVNVILGMELYLEQEVEYSPGFPCVYDWSLILREKLEARYLRWAKREVRRTEGERKGNRKEKKEKGEIENGAHGGGDAAEVEDLDAALARQLAVEDELERNFGGYSDTNAARNIANDDHHAATTTATTWSTSYPTYKKKGNSNSSGNLRFQHFSFSSSEHSPDTLAQLANDQLEKSRGSTTSSASSSSKTKKGSDSTSGAIKLNSPNTIPIFHSEAFTQMKSTFQGHCAIVNSQEQVDCVIGELLEDKKIRVAHHNQLAYKFRPPGVPGQEENKNTNLQVAGNDDDGESGAGKKIAELLEFTKVDNILIVVSRWYGGVHMGPDRFKCIGRAASDLIDGLKLRGGGGGNSGNSGSGGGGGGGAGGKKKKK